MSLNDISENGYLRWFIGFVVDVMDPLQLGRLKVRVPTMHDSIEDEDLPWASTISPIQSASYLGVGISPTGILPGSMVFGFFITGNEGNLPIVAGTIPKINENDLSKHDVNPLARGFNVINKERLDDSPEPASTYNAKYPYNKVVTTVSGHTIELDDTPGEERIHVYHARGSYLEINNDGTLVIKCVSNSFNIINNDQIVYIGANNDITVKGTYTLNVEGDYNLNVKKNINIKADGNVSIHGERIDLN